MAHQVGQALLHVFDLRQGGVFLARAAVKGQGAHRGHHHRGVRGQPRRPALDVQELFRAQVAAEARLGDHIIRQGQGHAGGDDGIAAVGDIGEGTAVHQRRRAFQGLHQIGLHRVLEQGAHGPGGLEILGGDGGSFKGITHHDALQPLLQVGKVVCQAEHRHDFAGHGDIEAVFPGRAVAAAAQTVHHIAQLPVVHVHAALPGNPPGIDSQGVALMNVIVQHGRQQVAGGGNGVEIAGEVQVDVLHGGHLSLSAAGGAALQAEYRAQRGLPQGRHGVFADFPQAVGEADAGGGFALAGGGGGNGRYQNQLALFAAVGGQGQLGLVFAVEFDGFRVDAGRGGDFANVLQGGSPGDFNIGKIRHGTEHLT